MHPETLALLDGAVLADAPLDSQESPAVVIWSLDSKNSSDATGSNAGSENSNNQTALGSESSAAQR